jgi:hypothetical protein
MAKLTRTHFVDSIDSIPPRSYGRWRSIHNLLLKKGTVSRDFRPSVFFHQTIPSVPPDSRAKAFLKSASNSPRYDRFSNTKIVHAVSMTPHALCMWCQWYRMYHASGGEFVKIRISSRIRIYIRKGFKPLGAQDECFDEKNRGSRISWHCPFKAHYNIESMYSVRRSYRKAVKYRHAVRHTIHTVQVLYIHYTIQYTAEGGRIENI